MKKVFVLILLIFSYPNVGFSHDDIEKKEITCSIEYEYKKSYNEYYQYVNLGWSFKFIKSHYLIPDGSDHFQISLEVHFQDGEVFLDHVYVYLKDGNIFKSRDSSLEISEDQYNQKKKIDKCYLIL